MSQAFPNSIRDGLPADAINTQPDGPDINDTDYTPGAILSHDDPGSLYDDLPDIAVPKHRVSY